MGLSIYCTFLFTPPLRRIPSIRAVNLSESGVYRKPILEKVSEELAKGNERTALSLVKELQGKPNGLRCFGGVRQVPQRLYSLDELKLNGIDASSLLSPIDTTLGSIQRNLQLAGVLGGIAAWKTFELSQIQLLFLSLGLLLFWSVDLIALNGGVANLVLDTIGHAVSKKYHERVIQHEAGHFLVAYLLGVLPKGYTLSSLEALQKEGSLNVQGGTSFVDFEFIEEINKGKVSSEMLNRFSCIALAGVTTEYLLFGHAEGGLGDIYQLDSLLKSLAFTQKKADSQVRWSVLNTITILRRHETARSKLVKAMSLGKTVGDCIEIIEEAIDDIDF